MKRYAFVLSFLIVTAVAAGPVLAQDNPFVGTWRLDAAKSKSEPGPALKSQTRTVVAEGAGAKYSFEGVRADGTAFAYSLAGMVMPQWFPMQAMGKSPMTYFEPAAVIVTLVLLGQLLEFFDLPADTRPENIRQQLLPSWDSLAMVQLITELEGAFLVTFDIDEIDRLRSYDEIRDALSRKGFSFHAQPISKT